MSFDDYAEHIYQKHRLCIALAVLKTKPPDLSSTQYIAHLQSKMADKMDDDEVTVCSEDFIVDDDDDSVTIVEDFDDGRIGDKNDGVLNNGSQASYDRLQSAVNLPENLSQTTYYNSCQSQIEPNMDSDVTYCESDLYIGSQPFARIEIDIDKTKPSNDKEFDGKLNNNLTSIDIDTQKTILYTVPGLTQQYTHYSPSQNEILIPNKYLYASNNTRNTITFADDNKINKNDNIKSNITTDLNSITNINSQNEGFIIETNFTNNTLKDRHILEDISQDKTSENRLPSQQIENNQTMNMISQNMDDVFSQNQDFSESILNTQHVTLLKENIEQNAPVRISDNSKKVFDYFDEIHNFNDENHFTDLNNDNSLVLQTRNLKETFQLNENLTDFSQVNDNIDNFDSLTKYIDTNHSLNTDHIKMNKNLNDNDPTQDFEPNHDSTHNKNAEIPKFEVIEEESDTIEVIPYKVLEEFNKIKTYLKRKDRRLSCDGYSTDSGYRSDSQRSSNRSALQLSGISINQSAYCLLNHIMQCPLVASTRDITSEIAGTLGQLIDRLHEEETYPPFLEELLDTIDILLRQVYKGQGCEDNEFLKKDEFIQRILLLTKSIHIQKHAIQKVTSILMKFHEKVTDKNITYELINIDEVENASYIFHLLEILLKKYITNKNISSQNSQLSQDEEKILKKSSITDIWRKKWNPNFKENFEGSRENRCVLKECSEILNKIIVDCVNSYSLVAFSALKCFNSMQS